MISARTPMTSDAHRRNTNTCSKARSRLRSAAGPIGTLICSSLTCNIGILRVEPGRGVVVVGDFRPSDGIGAMQKSDHCSGLGPQNNALQILAWAPSAQLDQGDGRFHGRCASSAFQPSDGSGSRRQARSNSLRSGSCGTDRPTGTRRTDSRGSAISRSMGRALIRRWRRPRG